MRSEHNVTFIHSLSNLMPALFKRYKTNIRQFSKKYEIHLKGKHTSFKIYWNLFHHADTLRTQMACVKQQTEEGKKSHCKTIESSYCTASSCVRYIKSHLSWYIKNPFGTRDSKENYEMHIDYYCTYMTICILEVKNQLNCKKIHEEGLSSLINSLISKAMYIEGSILNSDT